MGATVISSERVRQFRQRQRNGLVQLTVAVDEVRLMAVLDREKLLVGPTDDKRKIELAAEQFLDRAMTFAELTEDGSI